MYSAELTPPTSCCTIQLETTTQRKLGADIEAVRRGIGTDPRIGYHFIYAGTGYGGSCFPKDVKALIRTAASVGYEARIANGVAAVNERQRGVLVDKMLAHYKGDLAGRKFALWGLAFKPNTNDMREAPSRTVRRLLRAARVSAYDPVAGSEAVRLYGDAIEVCERRDDTLPDADGLIIVTEWNEFRSPDFHALREALKQPVIFDGRNLYDPGYLGEIGFTYYSIGRARMLQPAAPLALRRTSQ